MRRNNLPHETHGCCLSNGTVAALSREGMFCASRKTPEESTKCFPDCQKSRFAKNSAQKVFAGLFQKAADSKGRAFGRVPPDAKSFAFIRIRKGDATARWAVASWETLSRGFPMRRLTPHLGNLLPANQFFDTLQYSLWRSKLILITLQE